MGGWGWTDAIDKVCLFFKLFGVLKLGPARERSRKRLAALKHQPAHTYMRVYVHIHIHMHIHIYNSYTYTHTHPSVHPSIHT